VINGINDDPSLVLIFVNFRKIIGPEDGFEERG